MTAGGEVPPAKLAAGGHDRPLLSISLMVVGMLIAPMGDIAAKLLSSSLPVVQIAWMRSFLQMALLLPFVAFLSKGWTQRFTSNFPVLLLMGTFWAASTIFFYYAIAKNPIPNTLAVFFVCPLAVMALAPSLLGERFRLGRFVAVLVSLLGVLFVLRPGGDFHPTILFGFAAGIMYACYLMTHRKLSKRSSPLERTCFAGATACIIPLPAVLWLWEWPAGETIVPLIVLGLSTMGSHWMIALASQFADASVYAPFNYVEIVSATILSWIFFQTFPDLWAWFGILIIVGSGLYLMWRERKGRIPGQIAPP